MFERQEKIRYSETDASLHLTIPALLNYFQDAAIFEGENHTVCIEEMQQKGRTWVLNSWQVFWSRLPKLNEDVIVGTFPYDFKGFIGYRNFYMKNAESGEELACAASVWALIDLNNLHPVRLEEELAKRYPLSERLTMPYEGRRILYTGKGEQKETILIRKSQIDSNHHVNNAEYVNMAMDYVPFGRTIHQLRAEYKKSAMLNDEMIPVVYKEKDRVIVVFQSINGDIYALIEFRV